MTCNYCKKPGHAKTECRALKVKNGKHPHKGSRTEEVNFCGPSSTASRSTVGVTPEDDPNILNVESTTSETLVHYESSCSIRLGVIRVDCRAVVISCGRSDPCRTFVKFVFRRLDVIWVDYRAVVISCGRSHSEHDFDVRVRFLGQTLFGWTAVQS
jgi:hypothetical protein